MFLKHNNKIQKENFCHSGTYSQLRVFSKAQSCQKSRTTQSIFIEKHKKNDGESIPAVAYLSKKGTPTPLPTHNNKQ